MKNAFTHVKIESKAFPLNEEFSANCDEASRQEKIARHGIDLLSALRDLLQVTEKCMSAATIDRAICNAYEAITNATGKAPKF